MHPRRMWRNSQRRQIGVGVGRPGIGSGRGGGSIGGGGAGLGSGRGAGCCCRICCPTTEMRNRSRAAPRPGADLEDKPGNSVWAESASRRGPGEMGLRPRTEDDLQFGRLWLRSCSANCLARCSACGPLKIARSIPPSPSLSISSTRHSAGLHPGRGRCESRPRAPLPYPALRRDGLDAANQLRRLMVRLRPVRAHNRLARPHRPYRRQLLNRVADQRQRLPQLLQIGASCRQLLPHPLAFGPQPLQLSGRVFRGLRCK